MIPTISLASTLNLTNVVVFLATLSSLIPIYFRIFKVIMFVLLQLLTRICFTKQVLTVNEIDIPSWCSSSSWISESSKGYRLIMPIFCTTPHSLDLLRFSFSYFASEWVKLHTYTSEPVLIKFITLVGIGNLGHPLSSLCGLASIKAFVF